MTMALDQSFQKLGVGSVVSLNSGEGMFKMDSCKENPIVKPQDIGLPWHEDGQTKIGAALNGGA